MKFCINIIFTERTVKQLWIFVESLLRNSEINYRLVVNGCLEYEVEFLKDKVGASDRLQLLLYSLDISKPHHEVLNYLLSLDPEDPYFCFMDSDIFAVEEFVECFIGELDHADALFSCPPLSSLLVDEVPVPNRLQGRVFTSKNGFFVGASYFAIYKRRSVQFIIHKFGVAFERLRWDEISDEVQLLLESKDLKYLIYDTGKVLNILLSMCGFKTRYVKCPSLIHIGGISWASKYNVSTDSESVDRDVNGLKRVLMVRGLLAQYFSKLMIAYRDNLPEPDFPEFDNSKITSAVDRVRSLLQKIYNYTLP